MAVVPVPGCLSLRRLSKDTAVKLRSPRAPGRAPLSTFHCLLLTGHQTSFQNLNQKGLSFDELNVHDSNC